MWLGMKENDELGNLSCDKQESLAGVKPLRGREWNTKQYQQQCMWSSAHLGEPKSLLKKTRGFQHQYDVWVGMATYIKYIKAVIHSIKKRKKERKVRSVWLHFKRPAYIIIAFTGFLGTWPFYSSLESNKQKTQEVPIPANICSRDELLITH